MRIKQYVFLLSVFLLIQSGCSPSHAEFSKDSLLYNSSVSSAFYETNDYAVINVGGKYLCDKKTLELTPLTMDPLERFAYEDTAKNTLKSSNNARIFAAANEVYLLKNSDEGLLKQAKFTIDKLNMDTFMKSSFFRVGRQDSGHQFLGLMNMFPSNEFDSLSSLLSEDGMLELTDYWGIFQYFIYHNSLFTAENYHLVERNLKSGKRTVLTDKRVPGDHLACDGKTIYFLTDTNDIYAYSLRNKTSEKLFSDKVSDFYMTDDRIYYRNILDHGYLYVWNKKTGSGRKVAEISCQFMQADDHFLYYIDSDGNLCRIAPDGSQNAAIIQGPIGDYLVSKNADKIFYTSESGDSSTTNPNSSPSVYVTNKNGKPIKNLPVSSS